MKKENMRKTPIWNPCAGSHLATLLELRTKQTSMIRTSNYHGGRHACKNVLPCTSTLKRPHHLRSSTGDSTSSIAVPCLQLSTALPRVAAPHLSIGFRVAPNIKPQNLWNSFDWLCWSSYIYIYIYIQYIKSYRYNDIYIYHRWKDTVEQLTAES